MTVTFTKAAEAAVTISLNSLSSGGYATSSAITPASTDIDHHVRVTIADIAEAGSKIVPIFAIASNDGTTFEGSESDANMTQIGAIDMTNSTGPETGIMPVAEAFGGILPVAYKIVAKNAAGAALAASGNSAGVVAISAA